MAKAMPPDIESARGGTVRDESRKIPWRLAKAGEDGTCSSFWL